MDTPYDATAKQKSQAKTARIPIKIVPAETLKKPDWIRVKADARPKAVGFRTREYPAFPTDMQAQLMALMCQARGTSIITERIFESRFMHAAELMRLGADIGIEGPSAIVKGGAPLSGAEVMASDLRASAALVIAGIAASGKTQVHRVYHLDRGYERMEVKLEALGARINLDSERVAQCIRETGIVPDLAPWCDFELAAGQTGLAALSSAAAWCDLAEAATGRGPILYTGPAFISQLERLAGHAADAALARLALRPLSVAHYGPSIAHGPTVPAPWRDWALWQYSGDPAPAGQKARPWSTLPGTTIPVDVDFFRGDLAALRALGGP